MAKRRHNIFTVKSLFTHCSLSSKNSYPLIGSKSVELVNGAAHIELVMLLLHLRLTLTGHHGGGDLIQHLLKSLRNAVIEKEANRPTRGPQRGRRPTGAAQQGDNFWANGSRRGG